MKLTFYIPERKAKTDSENNEATTKHKETEIIQCFIRAGRERISISTKIEVEVQYWNKEKQTVEGCSRAYKKTIETAIQTERSAIEEAFRKLSAKYETLPDSEKKPITLTDIKNQYLFIRGRISGTPTNIDELLSGFKAYIVSRKTSKATQTQYLYLLRELKKTFTGMKIVSVNDITKHTLREILAKHQEQSLSYVQLMRVVFNLFAKYVKENYSDGVTSITIPEQINVTDKIQKKTDSLPAETALTTSEIQALEKYVSEGGTYKPTIALFLILCYTGQRFSDLKNITKAFTLNPTAEILTITQQKTGTIATIPISDKLRALLQGVIGISYGVSYSLLMQSHLRIVAKDLNFDRLIEITKHKGTGAETYQAKLYDVIGTHDGRRTFITRAFERGIDIDTIAEVTGHKTFEELRKYDRRNKAEKVSPLRNLFN